jgi:predicted Zn-dependent protease
MKNLESKITSSGFDDHRIIEINSQEHQLYLLKDRMESRRVAETHYYEITVYRLHTERGKEMQGEYTFIYKPGNDLRALLEQAKVACAQVKNRRYRLVDSAKIAHVQVLDPRLSNLRETGDELAEAVRKTKLVQGVRLSSAEIYLRKSTVTLTTSTGIELSKEKGLIEFEAALLSKRGKDEQELNFHIHRRSVAGLRLEERLREYGFHTRSMLDVQEPKSGQATVIFHPPEISNLLLPIVFHSSGRAKDKGISRFVPDEKITQDVTNTFTMKSSGLLPYGLYTDPFDDDGLPGQEHIIIDRGVFKKFWTSKRYADYLGVEPTGTFKNLVIEPVIKTDFTDKAYYEIIQFSDFSPDPVTGDFVAEIRFGYHVKNGKKTPVKGGSVGGNVFEALSHIYLTDGQIFEGDYLGPKFLALPHLTISGQ